MTGGVTRFGNVEFDTARGRLTVAGRRVSLDRSCVAILATLVAEAGTDVDKDRLLDAGWRGRVVHENSLAKAIGRLRHALGADGRALVTVHGYGYRLEADPVVVHADRPTAAASAIDARATAPSAKRRTRAAAVGRSAWTTTGSASSR